MYYHYLLSNYRKKTIPWRVVRHTDTALARSSLVAESNRTVTAAGGVAGVRDVIQ